MTPRPSGTPVDAPRLDPASAGFDPARLRRIEDFLTAEVAAGRIPGAVVGIARGDGTVFSTAIGHRDPVRRVPLTTDSLFWIASMTKPLTTVAALTLVEQGRLDLDAEVAAYLPEFADRRVADLDVAAPSSGADVVAGIATRPARRQPTVRDLLRHTAGIPEGFLGDTPVHAAYAEAVGGGMTDLTGAEFAGRLAALPLLHEPGSRWHYGWGLDLTGFVIESITGMSLGAYLHESVLAPSGMRSTTFGVPAGQGERYAAAAPTDPLTGAPQELPDLTIARFDSGGAGLVGSAEDYLRFIRLLLGGGRLDGRRLLGRKTVEHMLADQLDEAADVGQLQQPGWSPGHRFGLGLAVRTSSGGAEGPGSIGEVSWPGAAGTTWWADPREDLGVVFFTHTLSEPVQVRCHRAIRNLVLAALN
ncbi:CubicO group peptidase (beta-lactamase class C family) [Actinoalloteichus hoggarensis]|uniref:Esterase EstB n=1 Tax=Actinoalloteichus hoggarensis TaxID=1470176 RepID=A0A221W8U2_9PSEU|nr:serine hydrolase domain-containing protein [Actinoalloteichus hoggarensis]ASO22016.1 Esterase EstB [Actinoalloteichus hoggarensis]MBB5923903.1 CubicO group peptidase (beta-lactamase class C family) [Actinoalloteichus hoggarensis]